MENWTKGDLVWLFDPSLSAKTGSRKMTNPWYGPLLILDISPNKTATLLKPNKHDPRATIVVNVDRLRRYLAPIGDAFVNPSIRKFPVTLLSSKMVNGIEHFKVRWLSIKPVPDSWEPASSLPSHLINSFYRRNTTAIILSIISHFLQYSLPYYFSNII
jgi:hypothetical protein